MTETELLALIEQAEWEGWTELDFGGERIEWLPSEIERLTGLRRLRVVRGMLCRGGGRWRIDWTNLRSLTVAPLGGVFFHGRGRNNHRAIAS